jgi:hypothetical protein
VTREKLKLLLSEYGPVAMATYFAIFFLTLAGFALAITYGVDVHKIKQWLGGSEAGAGDSALSGAGLLFAAWLLTKATQPFRIAGTLALTPLVAAVLKRIRKGGAKTEAPGAPSDTPPEASS